MTRRHKNAIVRRVARLAALTAALTIVAAADLAPAHAGVMMEGFYWNCPSGYTYPWWYDHVAQQANTLASDGISAIWMPPPLKCASGGYSSGYDPFDDYDLGDKNQCNTLPTHYGHRLELERCCALLHANGIQIYEDIVDQHRNGYNAGTDYWQYINAYGTMSTGRYAKSPSDIYQGTNQDPDVWDSPSEPGDVQWPSFTPALLIANGGKPSGWNTSWNWANLEYSGDWLTKALDLNGYRFDYVKGIDAQYLNNWLTYDKLAGKFAVGEFYDTTLSNLQEWMGWEGNTMSLFDFPLRANYIYPMCEQQSGFWMSSLNGSGSGAGLAGVDPFGAVTFVENHDTDNNTNDGNLDPITQNKLLGYAYILTSQGYPCIFYRDWSTDAGCYGAGMQSYINKLIWINENIATGGFQQRWMGQYQFVYERTGGKHLLVGLNNSGSPVTYTVATGFGAGVQLTDYSGVGGAPVTTDSSGNATITIPGCVGGNGLGYCCYSVAGQTASITPAQNATTQEYNGAMDLDLYPADNTQQVQVGQIYVQNAKSISGALYYDTTGWTSSTYIKLQVADPNGKVLNTGTYYSTTTQGTALTATADMTGLFTFSIESFNTPATNAKPQYWLDATFTAPQQLTVACPTFSVAGGVYTTTQSVSIADTTPGATIYYTTNGTTPTTSSAVYSAPIAVSANETIEAMAIYSGFNNSMVSTATYTIATAYTFTIANCNTTYGYNVYNCGSITALGNWAPASAFALTIQGSGANVPWSGTVVLPANTAVQYKYIKYNGTSTIWEANQNTTSGNRQITTPASGSVNQNDGNF